MHSDPFSHLLLELALVMTIGYVGRYLAARAGQSSVLGELVLAVLVASAFRMLGGSALGIAGDLHIFSNLGIILLLFVVGLETSVQETLNVGPRASLVAVVGVGVPMLLGFLCSRWLAVGSPFTTHLFMGAILCATSVGITARVLQDLKRLGTREARIILAAAVIDDILGLIVLTLVSSLIAQGQFELLPLLKTVTLSILFLGLVMWRGEFLARALFKKLSILDSESAGLFLPLIVCFALAWFSSLLGLASIIGAFAAGLIVREEFFTGAQKMSVHERLQPLEKVFAPVFFVLMGLQVDLRSFANLQVALLTAALCIAAVSGKLACALVAGKNVDRLTVGIGMVPRGEVGLIFAGIGRTLGVLNEQVFSAVILMVIVTTLITPPALRWSLARQSRNL